MTIDLDAYGLAALSFAGNDPVTRTPFANRLTTHVPPVKYLLMNLLRNNFKRAVLTLVVLLFKLCLPCFAMLHQPQNHKFYGRAPVDALFLHSP